MAHRVAPAAFCCPGADLTNSVIDRAALDNTDLSDAKFVNAVITGTTFKGANLAGANFEDALIGRWAGRLWAGLGSDCVCRTAC